jgi:hypothetical protein
MEDLNPQAIGSEGPPRVIEVGASEAESPAGEAPAAVPALSESVEKPAKVMRMGSMIKQLLEEVRLAPLDEAGRMRLREIFETSVQELSSGLSPDLVAELERVVMPFAQETPSQAELRVAQAQLVGWLEGLFHGIQATIFAQQMAARAQAEEMGRRGLPGGHGGAEGLPEPRPGTYL